MGATASKDDGPLETLDADQVRDVVAGFGTQFAGAADKMREAGIDGDYLAMPVWKSNVGRPTNLLTG